MTYVDLPGADARPVRVLVDGQWQDDPSCPVREANQFGGQNCVCIVNGA